MTQYDESYKEASKHDDDAFLYALRHHFGYDSFRSIQLDIVRSIAHGHDTLGLMPTGGGKSITFQVPALTMEGVCIVITPLISLMKDQVMHLKEKGIHAEAIHSGLTHLETQRILDNAIYGSVKFLYVSPERLSNKLFIAKLYYMKVCFITIDEAHCISQWGYDFRPAYLKISQIRELVPNAPVLALTATATPLVVEDIKEKLYFGKYSEKEPQTFRMSFRRSNLSYVVRRTEDKIREIKHILEAVPGCAIIYTRNRDKTKKLAKDLCKEGINATYYHAGLDIAVKDKHQEQWQNDEVRVMVATNAFGMGIDKPDVRIVIHEDCPDSLEAYFQEAGRGGRDGKRSYAVLLFDGHDRSRLLKHASASFPPKEYIRNVYDHLAYFFELAMESGEGARFEFNKDMFCIKFKHYVTHLDGALSILQNAGYIHYEQYPDSSPRVMFSVQREELYHISGMSKLEDMVLEQLLRHYGSLFADLTYINDNLIASRCNITQHQLHAALKELAQKHIIRYIPRRNTPIITYTQQRIDSSRLRLNKDIYEVLHERLIERINHVLKYAESRNTCRQVMLMDYFGEKNAEECGQCDTCLEPHKTKTSEEIIEDLVQRLMGDGKEHHITELNKLGLTEAQLNDTIEYIRNSNNFHIEGSYVKLLK